MNNVSLIIVLPLVTLLFSCSKYDLISDENLESQWSFDDYPASVQDPLVRNDVPLQGFYKDVFMDAGVYLTTRNTLAAAKYLGLSLESVSCTDVSDTLWQNTVISGDSNDTNGRLLYPDGQPRYRLLFVCGGSSRSHGQSLRSSGRKNMRDFVLRGGSYVGTCAGGFFATTGYDSTPNYQYYLGIWPGMMTHTGLVGTKTGLTISHSSPLLGYYDYGGDNYVADVRHNKGGYAALWPDGTELLAQFHCPEYESVHGKPAAWAYKHNNGCGRVIMEGSHPEEVASGERRDFTAAMLRYALDGLGVTKIKGVLKKDEPWVMNKRTIEADPLHTMIGDLQYHHFAVMIPDSVKNVVVSLQSNSDCDFQLSMCYDSFAYSDVADFITDTHGANKSLFFPVIKPGLWYVAVHCLTTVDSIDVPLGQEYSGRIDVLNGVPYSVSVSWETMTREAL